MELFFLLSVIGCFIVAVFFIRFLVTGKLISPVPLGMLLGALHVVLLPLVFLVIFDINKVNDCCGDSAFFAPHHRLSIYIVCGFSIAAYFYSELRTSAAPPLVEVLVNCLLLTGIGVNVAIVFQNDDAISFTLGSLPIILLFILMLVKNYRVALKSFETAFPEPTNKFEWMALKIMTLSPIQRFPVLFLLCFPILLLLVILLLLFGQRPDSLIRAFTDTYKHGLSQLDYQCNQVICNEGHYLCTVAAQGHSSVVKPLRLGIRGDKIIRCNRQLLISNAFEELIEQKLPGIHKAIRRLYNGIGNLLHRHYHLFRFKIISDLVYFLMKPLEWIFLIVLYLFDKKPENRIASQYLSLQDQQCIAYKN